MNSNNVIKDRLKILNSEIKSLEYSIRSHETVLCKLKNRKALLSYEKTKLAQLLTTYRFEYVLK